jgi:hypothetical protein
MEDKYTDPAAQDQVLSSPSSDEALPVIVKIKPGTAAEKSLRVLLPADRVRDSIGSVLEYSLRLREEDGVSREGIRIQDRIKTEMKGQYTLTVNSQSIKDREQLLGYLKEDLTEANRRYLGAEIIVASKEEGALGLERTF